MTDEFDTSLPYICVWIGDYFATIYENGDMEFYCDKADLRVPLQIVKQFVFKADRFMHAREMINAG